MTESTLLTPSNRAHSLVLAPSSLRPAINQSNAVPTEEEIVNQSISEIAALNQSIFIEDPLNPTKISEATINQSPRLRFEQAKPSRSIDYQYDGDMSMETDQSINQRRALKLDPLIQTWISVFWKTYRKTEVQIPSDVYEQSISQSVNQTGTSNGRPSISSSLNQPNQSANQAIKMVTISGVPKSEYLRVHALMYRCLHTNPSSSQSSVNQSIGLKDWTRDIWLSSSPHILDENAHFASLFELVDTWTLTVEKDEYAHFLAVLFHRITRIRSWLVEADQPADQSADQSNNQTNNQMVLQSKYVWRRLKHVNNATCYRPFNYAKYSAIRWKRWQQVLHQVDEDDIVNQSNEQSTEGSSSEFDTEEIESSGDEYAINQAIHQAKKSQIQSSMQSRAQSAKSLSVQSVDSNSEASSSRSVNQSINQSTAHSVTSTSRSVNQSTLSRPRTGDDDSEAWRVSSDDSITSSDDDSDDSTYGARASISQSMSLMSHDDPELERAKRQLAQLEATKAELRNRSKNQSKSQANKKVTVSLVPPDVSMLGTAPPSPAVTSGDDSEIDEQTLKSINQTISQTINQSEEMKRLVELQDQLTLAEQTIIQRRDEVEHDLIATIQSINQSNDQSHNQPTDQSNAVSDDESAAHSSSQSSSNPTPKVQSTLQSTHQSPKASNQSLSQTEHQPIIIELLSTAASIEAADILAAYGLSPSHQLSARTAHELGVQALKTRPNNQSNQSVQQNEVDKLKSMIEAVQITRDQSKTIKAMKKRVKSINQSSNLSGEHGELDEIAEYIADIMKEKKVEKKVEKSKKSAKTTAVVPAKASKKDVEKPVAPKKVLKPAAATTHEPQAKQPANPIVHPSNNQLNKQSKKLPKKPVRKSQLTEPIVEESEAEIEKEKTPREPEQVVKQPINKPVNQNIKPAPSSDQSLEQKLASARAREKLPEPVVEPPKPVEQPKPPVKQAVDQSADQSAKYAADKLSKTSLIKKMKPPPVLTKPVTDNTTEQSKKPAEVSQPNNKQSMIDQIKQSMEKPAPSAKPAPPAKITPPSTASSTQSAIQSTKPPIDRQKSSDQKHAPILNQPSEPSSKQSNNQPISNQPEPAPVAAAAKQPIKQSTKPSVEQPKPASRLAEPAKEVITEPAISPPITQSAEQTKLPSIKPASPQSESPPPNQSSNQPSSQSRPPSRPSSASIIQTINQSRPGSASYKSRPSSRQAFTPTPIRPFDQSNNSSSNPSQPINMGFAPIDTSMEQSDETDSPVFSPISFADSPQSVYQSNSQYPDTHLSPTHARSNYHSNNQSKNQSPYSTSGRLNSRQGSRPSSRAGQSNNQSNNQSNYQQLQRSPLNQPAGQSSVDKPITDEFGHEILSSRSVNDDDDQPSNGLIDLSQHQSRSQSRNESNNQPRHESNNQSTIQSNNQSRSQSRPTTAFLMARFEPKSDRSTEQSAEEAVDEQSNEPHNDSVSDGLTASQPSSDQTNKPAKKLTAAERFAIRQREREAAEELANQSRQAFYEAEQSAKQSVKQPGTDQSTNQSIENSLREESSRLADAEMVKAHQSVNLSTRWSMRAKEVERAEARARSEALNTLSINQIETKWQAKQEKLLHLSRQQSMKQTKMMERKAERERRRQAVQERREALKQSMRQKQMIERLVDDERREEAIYRARAELEERSEEARARRDDLLESTELRALHGNDVLSPYSFLPLAQPGVHTLKLANKQSEKRVRDEARRAQNAANRAALAAERLQQLEQWKLKSQMSAARQQQLLDAIEAAHRARFDARGEPHVENSPEAQAAAAAEEAVVSELTEAVADDWSFAIASGFGAGYELRPSVVDMPLKLPKLAQIPSASFAPSNNQANNQSIITVSSLLSPRVVAAAASRMNVSSMTSSTGVSHERGMYDHTLMVPTAEPELNHLSSTVRFRDPPVGGSTNEPLGLNEFIASHPLVAALTSRGLFPNQSTNHQSNQFDLRSTFSTGINPSDQSELLSVRANIRRELALAKDRDRLKVDSELKRQRLADAQTNNQSLNQSIARRYEEKIARIEFMRKQRDQQREMRRLDRLVEAARRKEDRVRRQQTLDEQHSIDQSNRLAEMVARDAARKKLLDQQLEKQMWARLAAKIDRESKEIFHKWKGETEQKESTNQTTDEPNNTGQLLQNNYVNPLNNQTPNSSINQTINQSWQHHLDQRARSLAMKQILRRDFDQSINQYSHDSLGINLLNTHRPSRRPRVHAHGLNPSGYVHPSYHGQSNNQFSQNSIANGFPGLTVVKQQPAKRKSGDNQLLPISQPHKPSNQFQPLQFTDGEESKTL